MFQEDSTECGETFDPTDFERFSRVSYYSCTSVFERRVCDLSDFLRSSVLLVKLLSQFFPARHDISHANFLVKLKATSCKAHSIHLLLKLFFTNWKRKLIPEKSIIRNHLSMVFSIQYHPSKWHAIPTPSMIQWSSYTFSAGYWTWHWPIWDCYLSVWPLSKIDHLLRYRGMWETIQ